MQSNKAGKHTSREAVAVFLEAEKLTEAATGLEAAGVNTENLGIMAREGTIRERFGNTWEQVREFTENTPSREAMFIRKESGDVTVKGLTGGLYFAGGTAAMGAIVSSAAILGGPVAVAVSGALAVGVVGTLVGNLIHKSDAEFLREQLDEGHVLLFVPIPDASQEAGIRQLLGRHSPIDVKVYDVPASA